MEYRIVASEAELLLAYEKTSDEVGGGLNPLHHASGRAVKVGDEPLLAAMTELTRRVAAVIRLGFYAIDVIDGPGGLRILELNPNPFCFFYNRSNGRGDFVAIYEHLLDKYIFPDMSKKRDIETDLIHSGEGDKIEGSVVLPVFQSATYLSGVETAYEEIRYLRLNNSPNHRVLHAKLAAVCGGEAAIVTSSGMAAIAATLMGLLKAGDRLLAQSCLYGGTHSLFTDDLPDFGLQVDFIDCNRPDSWGEAATRRTRAIYVETMTNPLLEVADLEAVVAFARERGLISIIDNTFGTPVNFRPLQLGFDVEIHSATKYLNGHSDIVAGCVVAGGELISRIGRRLNHLGATLDPHACFLLHRGIEDDGAEGAAPERLGVGPSRGGRALRGGDAGELPRAGLASSARARGAALLRLRRGPELRALRGKAGCGEVAGAAADTGFRPQPRGRRDPDHAAGSDLARRPVGSGAADPGNRQQPRQGSGRHRVRGRPDRRFRAGAGGAVGAPQAPASSGEGPSSPRA